MYHLVTNTGDVVAPGSMLTATSGPWMGKRFRFVEVHVNGTHIVVRFNTPHPFKCAFTMLHPSVFGAFLRKEITRVRHCLNRVHVAWQKVDEWLLAGAFALVPLALFEAFHGGEATRELITSLFNSHANTGGHSE